MIFFNFKYNIIFVFIKLFKYYKYDDNNRGYRIDEYIFKDTYGNVYMDINGIKKELYGIK